MKRIHDSLALVLSKHRLVFWYDGDGEWLKEFETFSDEGVDKIPVENNEFGVKIRILREPDTQRRFLLYFRGPRPPDTDNWLLDLYLQGHEYNADRASLALQEAGLPYDFHHVVEQHLPFFNSSKRVEALRRLLQPDDDADVLRLKMMAVQAGTDPQVDLLLLHFLGEAAGKGSLLDPVTETLGSANLVEAFWKSVILVFAYGGGEPSLADFAAGLFRAADPLDSGVALHPHARVFLQQWKDSQTHAGSFEFWSGKLEIELHVSARLESLENLEPILDADAFQVFEKKVIHSLCKSFEAGEGKDALISAIQRRGQSFWFPRHEDGFRALEEAIELRELIAGAELTVDTLETGFGRYVQSWWRIDAAYRRFWLHARNYAQNTLMEAICDWVEKAYVNNYLLPLADRWGDLVGAAQGWGVPGVTSQTVFYEEYVRPFLQKDQKAFVVVSDALRYEAAQEFASRLRSEDRWTCEVDAVLASLPSYTQLGMASLLPGSVRDVDSKSTTVTLDGKSTAGVQNRKDILAAAVEGKGTAVQAEEFLEMNTKTEGRALMRDHEVVYIFHNTIDATGDSPKTEAQTVEAVERAFDELLLILKKLANINASHMVLTADHGFLFQQDDVEADDMAVLPEATEWTARNRRYALGVGVQPGAGVKVFRAGELGLTGEWAAAFPLSLGRFPLQGSGKRYVHGGISLQEVVVPVLRIHKTRSSDTRWVEVDVMRLPSKITTGQASFSLYQEEPVSEKVLPRSLRIGVFAKDDTPLSEVRTLDFDSTNPEARLRESTVVLTLARAADDFNNQQVELRLQETLPGTSQSVVYKSFELKIQKPFGSDFDDL